LRTQHSSKSALFVSVILTNIMIIIGWIISVFFILGIIGVASTTDDSGKAVALFFCFMCLIVGVCLILSGSIARRRMKRVRQYLEIISEQEETPLQSLAAATEKSIDYVKKDLQFMLNKKLIKNVVIDLEKSVILVQHKASNENSSSDIYAEKTTVICSGCGAKNIVLKGKTGECEFCGSPLKG